MVFQRARVLANAGLRIYFGALGEMLGSRDSLGSDDYSGEAEDRTSETEVRDSRYGVQEWSGVARIDGYCDRVAQAAQIALFSRSPIETYRHVIKKGSEVRLGITTNCLVNVVRVAAVLTPLVIFLGFIDALASSAKK